MKRREFITLLGGVAVATWSPAARAQSNRVRRVAALMLAASTAQHRMAVLREELQKLGWTEGRNFRLDVRIPDDAAALWVAADEVVKSAPEVIFTVSGTATRVIQTLTRTVPIVFDGGGDATGLVSNVAKPEGNTTGFANIFPTLGGKYLELLKEAAPHITRVAIVFDANRLMGSGEIASVESARTTLGTTTVRAPFRNSAEIESAVEAFAAEPNGALVLLGPMPGPAEFATIQRLALKHRLPLAYQFTGEGVLISYAADPSALLRGAASYIDRILRGAKPGELPVQYPTKFRLAVNLKAAKAIGLTIPDAFRLRADEVIE
jgi:putative ABC transport system substrate-binding protein